MASFSTVKTLAASASAEIPTSKRPLVSSPVASKTLQVMTDYALVQFVQIYESVIMQRQVLAAPSSDDLLQWMREAIYGDFADDVAQEVIASSSAAADAEAEPNSIKWTIGGVEVDDNAKAITEKLKKKTKIPDNTSSDNQKINAVGKKIDAKLLKKVVMKQEKTGKDGTTKTVDAILDLPYLPHCVDYSHTCQAIKVNGNLFTPCLTRPAKDSKFCKICAKGLKYGTVTDRENVQVGEFTDLKGKKEISYGTWLQKRNIERSFVEELLAKHFGGAIQIPESYYEVNRSKARRSLKKKSDSSSCGSDTSSTDEVSVEVNHEQSRRGRPSENISITVTSTPDLVEEEENVIVNSSAVKDSKQEEEPQQLEEEEVSSVEVSVSKNEPEDKSSVKDNSSDLEEEEEEEDDGIIYITYNGHKLCYDEDNVLIQEDEDGEFNIVGEWNPDTKEPVFSKEYQHLGK